MNNSELLPCPFCGSNTTLTKSPIGYLVSCTCKYMNDSFETESEAIEAWNTRPTNVANVEEVVVKLEETTNYLVTISKRLMSDFPFGIGTECYFISEDVKNALENIGGELANTFAKEIEKAELQNKLSDRKLSRSVTNDQ